MNIDIKTLIPNASESTKRANPHLYGDMGNDLALGRGPTSKNDVQPIVERKKAKHETNHQRKIQDSEQCEQTPALGGEGEREASGAKCPLIGFTLYRVKLLDWEAKYSSVKDLLDGCVAAGLLDGDREDQIDPKSYVIQKKVSRYSEERTEIQIEL